MDDKRPEEGDPGELIWEGAPTWRSRVGMTVLWSFLLLGGIGGYVGAALHFGFSAWPALAIGGVPLAAGLFLLLLQWIQLASIRYRLTTRRIEWQTGLLSRTIDGIDVSRIRHVEYHQSIGDRLGGVSRLHVFVQDAEDPEIVIFGLPKGRDVYDRVARAAQISRQRTLQIVE